MFGIGISELVLIVVIALIVVGPKNLPVTLRAIGRAIGEFRRASRELRNEVGLDEVVDEVARPLREGMAEVHRGMSEFETDLRGAMRAEQSLVLDAEYPPGGPDDYGALPESADPYPDLPAYPLPPEKAAAIAAQKAKILAAQKAMTPTLNAKPATLVRSAGHEGTVAKGSGTDAEAARVATIEGTVARGTFRGNEEG